MEMTIEAIGFSTGFEGKRPSSETIRVANQIVRTAKEQTLEYEMYVHDTDGALGFMLRLNNGLLLLAELCRSTACCQAAHTTIVTAEESRSSSSTMLPSTRYSNCFSPVHGPDPKRHTLQVHPFLQKRFCKNGQSYLHVFQDRVEIVTPGGLPAGMREEDLGSKSVPRNPLLFSMLYRMKLVEQIGSGIRRIHEACREHGVPEPAIQVSSDWLTVTLQRQEGGVGTHHVAPHVAPHVAGQVARLIMALRGEMGRAELMDAMGLRDRSHFYRAYLQPGLDMDLVEMTLPDRPRSRAQRYRLTILGEQVRESQRDADDA